MSGHGHGHDHSGGCCHSSDDVESADNLGLLYSLYSKIDLENLTTLNEEQEGSGKTIFRSWDERLLKTQVGNPSDDQTLVFCLCLYLIRSSLFSVC